MNDKALRILEYDKILDLLTDCGKIYFKDKEELLARKNDAKAVEATLEDAKPVKKVAVKTKTKK